jgi:hypothetical protein
MMGAEIGSSILKNILKFVKYIPNEIFYGQYNKKKKSCEDNCATCNTSVWSIFTCHCGLKMGENSAIVYISLCSVA